MAIPITTVAMNLGASNAVETTSPRTAQMTYLVQPNARSVHKKYTRPTTKDAVFINPLPKNALMCSQGSFQSQMNSRCKGQRRTYAEATVGNSNNLNSEPISNILSQFITQLDSLITPLIFLLSSLFNTLLSKNTLSP